MALTTKHFRDQHAQLLAMASRLTAIVSERNLEAHPGAARAALEMLAAHLRVHLAAEDHGLYPHMRKSQDPQLRSTAEQFGTEMGGLEQAFTAYAQAWTEGAIRGDARGFTSATTGVLTALRQRIERENSTLYPLADGIEVSVPGQHQPPRHGSPLIIFIVDDNDGDFLLLTEAWRETTVSCVFEHFPVAEKLLDRVGQPTIPDLIIIDMDLPIHGGKELVRRLRARSAYQRVPIVMCSSATRARDSEEALACGATGFFPKPTTFSEYLPFVNTMNDLIAYYRAS